MPQTEHLRIRQDADDDVLEAINVGLRRLADEVDEADGFALAGPVKVSHTVPKRGSKYVTVSAKLSDVPTTGDTFPVRSRHNLLPGSGYDLGDEATAALRDLHAKSLAEGRRVVGPLKISHSKTDGGDEFLTVSGWAVHIPKLLSVGRRVLILLDALSDSASPGEYKEAVEPLREAVAEAHEYL